MDRLDFYDTMNIKNAEFSNEIHINKDHSLGASLLVGTGATIATTVLDAPLGVSIAVGAVTTIGLDALYSDGLDEGDYCVEHVFAEVYDGSSEQYITIVTNSYYKIGIDENGDTNKQYVRSVTKFFGFGKESIIDNADFL